MPWTDILDGLITAFGPGAVFAVLMAALVGYLWRQHDRGRQERITFLERELAREQGRSETLITEARDFVEKVGQDRGRDMRTLGDMAQTMRDAVSQNRDTLAAQREEHRDYLTLIDNQRRDGADERRELLAHIEKGFEQVVDAIRDALHGH